MYAKRYQLRHDLHVLLGITITLTIIGILFVYSSSSVYAQEHYASSYYFLKRQCIGLILGLIAFSIIRIIPLCLLQKVTPLFFWSSWFLTFLTLIPALSLRIHGSSRWLSLASFSFQPSELLKLSMIMYLARFLAQKTGKKFTFISHYLPFLVIVGIVSLVLLRQPDFGLTVTLASTALLMLFIANLPIMHLLITLVSCLPLLALLIYKNQYRLNRIATFLNPWNDPQGAGFQIIQSLIAIGSGNWFGTGIAHSKQKFFYLPMQHTDFIFSIIAEEIGFIGVSCIIILYCAFTYFGLRIAWQLKESYAIFTTIGFTLLITLQTMINIFVVTGLLPTKGIGLPFISYGNSALLCSLCMIGVIANLVDNNPQ